MTSGRFLRLLLVLTILAITSAQMVAAQMSGGLFVPMGGGPMPNYFSGTNCRASGSGQIQGAIESAYLKVNSQVVASYQHIPGEPYHSSIGLKAMFDSSHFNNGATATVRLEINGYITGQHTKTGSAVVQNQAMFFEDPDPPISPDPSVVFNGLFSGSGYHTVLQNVGGWTKPYYFQIMADSNFVVFCGHGTAASHYTGIAPADYLTARQSTIGPPVPPYPPFTAGSSPINILYLLSCNGGDTTAFESALWPHYMGWGGPLSENQAVIAYTVYIPVGELHKHADIVGGHLRDGYTVQSTKMHFELYLSLHPDELEAWDTYNFEDPDLTPPRPMKNGDLITFGDGKTRVKSVYTGSNVNPVGWYQQL